MSVRVKADRWLPAILVAAAGVFVFHGALAYYFSQDDFAALGRAAGLIPRFDEPWRFLSLQLYFDVMRPLVGLSPGPYHAVSLAGHALCCALVYAVLRAVRLGGPASLAGAGFFAAHASSFAAVYWISTIGDLYAVAFGLLALLFAMRRDALRWSALPAFAVSLLFKESLVLLPAAVLAVQALHAAPGGDGRTSDRRSPLRDPLIAVLAVLAVVYLAYFLVQNGLAAPATDPAAEPYSIGAGGHVAANLFTYLGWTANFLLATVRGFTDAVDPAVYTWGVGLLAVWGAGMFLRALRARGWLAAGAVYAAFLLPVLPLEHHTYHYYLYAPLVGAAWACGALVDALLAGRARATGPGAAPWLVAAVLLSVFAWNGRLLVHKIETHPFRLPGLRAEPLIDRALIAKRVADGLRTSDIPGNTVLRFWSPEAAALGAGEAGPPRPGRSESYWERNVRTALYDGLAVRLLRPEVRDVTFEVDYIPGEGDSVRWAMYRVTGDIQVLTPAELDSLIGMPHDLD